MKNFKTANMCWLTLCLAGCAVAANDIKKDTKIVDTHLAQAQENVAQADEKIISVTTQPSVSTEAKGTLFSAHKDLTAADQHIASARGVLPAINKTAQKLEDQRDAERNHWIGYRGRVALWSIVGVVGFFVIVGFILSGGNFELLGAVWQFLWGIIKPGLVAIGHVMTLGLVALASHMKQHHEQKKQSTNAPTAATSASA